MASSTKIVEELAQMIAQLQDSGQNAGTCITAAVRKDIQKNRPLTDTMDEIAYNELKHQNKKLKNKVREAEGELSIIKGIGSNSPEMKALQARVKELENSLSIALDTNDTDQRERKKLYEQLDLKQKELDRSNKENNNLFKRIAELTK